VRGEGIRGEKRKRVAAEAEAEQGGVDLREEGSSVKKKPKVSRVKKSYADQKKMLKHAEDLIAPSVIGMMAAVYRDHTGTRSLTSHIYIRRAILKEPEQAQGLAEDMLSGQEQQIKAPLDRIGCPGGKVKQPEAPLPLPDAIVERIIGQVAQHRKASRDTALQVVRKGLTAEIAKELQDPLSFQAAVDKLLFKRPYKARLPGRSVKTLQ